MDSKQRCQSCGMPLGAGFFGTEKNGVESSEYCKFCWKDGSFTSPGRTMEQMIEMSIISMTDELKMPKETADKLARDFIPKLKRWQKNK
jgi:Putative zinc ribbon domain